MPKNATTDPRTGLRTYQWMGRDLLSVTSLRRIIGTPFALAAWQVNQMIGAALTLQDSISSVDLEDPKQVAAMKKALRSEANAKRDEAADRGSAVHEAAALRLAPTAVDHEISQLLTQYYEAEKALKLNVLLSERQVWNLSLGYAGSFDIIGECQPRKYVRRALIDIKAGKGVWADHLLQLGSYLHAEFVGEDNVIDYHATDILKSVDTVAVLHLRPFGWEYIELDPTGLAVGGDTFNAITAMITLANWFRANPKLDSQIVTKIIGGDPMKEK